MNNFTLYIGPHKRWIEIRPLYISEPGKWPELSGEYIIYSNDRRNPIGELQPEHNQDTSILGSFFYTIGENIGEFKGKETLIAAEIRDIRDAIKCMVVFHYGNCVGMTVISSETYR